MYYSTYSLVICTADYHVHNNTFGRMIDLAYERDVAWSKRNKTRSRTRIRKYKGTDYRRMY